jgi:hypothetical protein
MNIDRRALSWRTVGGSASAAALVAILVYGLWLAGVWRSGHDVRDFIRMGHRYVFEPGVKMLFRPDPHYPYSLTNNGYDGQFSYYIAVDPVNARFHVDRPDYRYTRILYPMTARLLSFGRVDLIPYMLILINWFALGAGTFVVALWLKRKQLSPWFALVYGLSPGLLICLQRDLEEPMAYGLVALGVYLFSYGGRRRIVWSAMAFGLAVLTRESTAVFPAVLGLRMLFDAKTQLPSHSLLGRVSRAALLLVPALAPLALYKAFLLLWIAPNSPLLPPALFPQLVPFAGILVHWPWDLLRLEVVTGVTVPALICAGVGVYVLWKSQASTEVWLLLANVQLFVVMLNPLTYANILGAARVTTGIVLAAILCLPAFDRFMGRNRTWFWLTCMLWFAPWPSLVPFSGRLPTSSDLLLDLGGIFLLWLLAERQIMAPTRAIAYDRESDET